MVKISPGTLIHVPIDEDHMVACIVLFLSNHFKNVILLGGPVVGVNSSPTNPDLAAALRFLIYTSRESIDAGRWKQIGHLNVQDIQQFSERIVAQDVWVGDVPVRKAEPADRKRIPVMRVAGETAVENLIREIIYGDSETRMTQVIRESSEALLRAIR